MKVVFFKVQGSIFYIENDILPPPLSEIIFFPPYLHLQECKIKHIFDHFVLVFEQIVFINFHFLSPSPLLVIFPQGWEFTHRFSEQIARFLPKMSE